MIAATSKAAYRSIQTDLSDRQQAVFDAIEHLGSASNEMLSEHLGWPINCITPRVNELAYKGFVGVEGLTTGRSGRSAKLWSVRDPEMDNKVKELDCEG